MKKWILCSSYLAVIIFVNSFNVNYFFFLAWTIGAFNVYLLSTYTVLREGIFHFSQM